MMDWGIGPRLTPDWQIGRGLTLDWRIGNGLALDWQNDLGLNHPPLRHFGRSPIVLVPLSKWGFKLGLVKYWHDLCQFSADREDLSEIVHRGD